VRDVALRFPGDARSSTPLSSHPVLRRWDDRRVPGIQPLGRRRRGTNYPRRQEYRRVSHAGRLALTSGAVAGLALFLVAMRAALPAVPLLAIAVTLGIRARHWLSLAGRSRVGARSEDEVRRALEPLRQHGWRVLHALRWAGRGDIDSVAIVPNGDGFAIETKTRTYDQRHLGRVREQARWLGRHRRRWCGGGAHPVLCVVRAAGVERCEKGVLVVSIDRLVPVLWDIANRTSVDAASPTVGGVARRR
jgi:Nuclease-related domain